MEQQFAVIVGDAYSVQEESDGVVFSKVDLVRSFDSFDEAEKFGEEMLGKGSDSYVVLGAYTGWVRIDAGAFTAEG